MNMLLRVVKDKEFKLFHDMLVLSMYSPLVRQMKPPLVRQMDSRLVPL